MAEFDKAQIWNLVISYITANLHCIEVYQQFQDLFIMNRIDRLFGILTLLQSKKFVPAEKIADKFRISVRTVYRDIKALDESGIPISFEQQKGYFVV